MPELPEVETIKRGLSKFILSKYIKSVDILCEKSFIGPDDSMQNFCASKSMVEGQKIVEIDRRGKALLIKLSNQITMMIHLRMTGQLIYRKTNSSKNYEDGKITNNDSFAGGHPSDNFIDDLPNKQTRVIFTLNNNGEECGKLFFNDQRKFGFVKLIPTSEIEDDPFIKKLAKEPWDMSFDEFKKNLMKHKNSNIKATILDQTVIAGVGNIYADEALFASKIHPERLVSTLKDSEIEELLKNTAAVMDASINSGGSTMATYVRADGSKGDYLEKFAKVFRHEGVPCVNCGTEIVKIRVAGRGTHICPNCQKK